MPGMRPRWNDWLIGIAGVASAVAAVMALTQMVPLHEDLTPDDLREDGMPLLCIHGQRVAYAEHGHGDRTVLMIHGFAGSHRTWRTVQAMLGARFRVICLDLLGFGASERPATLIPSDWTAQVLGLMDALAIGDAVLVGHSIGGRVAMECAMQAPRRVRGLALVGSDGAQMLTRYPFLWAMARTPLLRLMLYRLTRQHDDVMHLLRTSYADDYPITEEMIANYQRPLRVQGTYAALQHLGQVYPGGNLTPVLRHITCPVTLLWGEKDRVTPVQSALEMLAALPTTELLIYPNIGHLPQEECPERVVEHLERFISRLE
jgi:pimeloyl-ACP methyl ester carboxylesterase